MMEIEGISHPTILSYFETLNAGEFEATSDLFDVEGAMQPPFETPITGREAIATYLKKEAPGLVALPQKSISQEDIQIAGKVQMPMFSVNVTWFFTLNPEGQITFTRIKLNASPKELIKLRSASA
jgi:hypothetical protein